MLRKVMTHSTSSPAKMLASFHCTKARMLEVEAMVDCDGDGNGNGNNGNNGNNSNGDCYSCSLKQGVGAQSGRRYYVVHCCPLLFALIVSVLYIIIHYTVFWGSWLSAGVMCCTVYQRPCTSDLIAVTITCNSYRHMSVSLEVVTRRCLDHLRLPVPALRLAHPHCISSAASAPTHVPHYF